MASRKCSICGTDFQAGADVAGPVVCPTCAAAAPLAPLAELIDDLPPLPDDLPKLAPLSPPAKKPPVPLQRPVAAAPARAPARAAPVPAPALRVQPPPEKKAAKKGIKTSTLVAGFLWAVAIAVVAGIFFLVSNANKLAENKETPAATNVGDAPAHPLDPAALAFIRWNYKRDAKGTLSYFEKRGGTWIEIKPGQPNAEYKETDRTKEFVELYDDGRKAQVRLLPTKAQSSSDREHWTQLAENADAIKELSLPPPEGDQGSPASVASAPSFDDWLQDFEEAKRRAAKENKDILVAFDGSDWCGWSIRMAYEVFLQPEFRRQVDSRYVLVFLDFPQKVPAMAKVQSAERNERMSREFDVDAYPTIIVTDAQGRPYGRASYIEGGVGKFVSQLNAWDTFRTQRDFVLQAVDMAQGREAKIAAVKKAIAMLEEMGGSRGYGADLAKWLALADQFDPKNSDGFNEMVFEANWLLHFNQMERDPEHVEKVVRELDDWKLARRFHDSDRAAKLHLLAGVSWALVNDNDEAARYFELGLASKPQSEALRAQLKGLELTIRAASIGSGFVVSPSGYILTNHHVIAGGRRIMVQLDNQKSPIEARVIADDEHHDMALVKISVPAGTVLAPLSLTADKIERGMPVAAFGFPAGEATSPELTLTVGVVSKTIDQSSNGMMVLDCRVNPGNSGGPLCNNKGDVVGMVTAKSLNSRDEDSYGMALPAPSLRGFLDRNLPQYQPPARANREAGNWQMVNSLVTPAVVMITTANDNPQSLIDKLHRNSPTDWQAAERLAELLANDHRSRVRGNARMAADVAAILAARLKGGEMDRNAIRLREYLCASLGEFTSADSLPILLKAATTERGKAELPVREAACGAIAGLCHSAERAKKGPPANPELLDTVLKLSRDPDQKIRQECASALEHIGGAKATGRLAEMLTDPDIDVTYNAALRLARLGDDRCVPVLAKIVDVDQSASLAKETDMNAREWKRHQIMLIGLTGIDDLAKNTATADLSSVDAPLSVLRGVSYADSRENAAATSKIVSDRGKPAAGTKAAVMRMQKGCRQLRCISSSHFAKSWDSLA